MVHCATKPDRELVQCRMLKQRLFNLTRFEQPRLQDGLLQDMGCCPTAGLSVAGARHGRSTASRQCI